MANPKRILPIPLAAAVVVAGGLLWWRTNHARRDGMDSPVDGKRLLATNAFVSGDANKARKTLGELKAQLAGRTREEAVAAIRAELASGRDAATGLGFKIAAGSALSETPSARVFLLDELARLDPAAAAELARSILATKTSADEWAVAMRNLARVENNEGGRAFLEGKMRELLTHEPWQREASAGFLEAFDVAVYLRTTNLVPELAALVRQTDNRAVSHAAYLTLDRLTIETPAQTLARLAEDPALMTGREVTRANYFARAEVGDAAQRALLESYLLDARRSPEELKTLAGLFPNANFMISQNLLTTVSTPDRATLAARDQTALRVVNEWLAEARFSALKPQLEQMRARLENFVRQAGTH